jgi:hypothetical protein
VSLWDRIIEAKEDARFTLPFVRSKYKLLDQARGASAGARAAGARHATLFCGALRVAEPHITAAGPAPAWAERKPDALLERHADCGPPIYGAPHLSAGDAARRVRSSLLICTRRALPKLSAFGGACRYTRVHDGAGLRTSGGIGHDRARHAAAAAAAAAGLAQ